MPNHFHFLIRQNGDIPISKFILKVCTSYSMYFNRRSERSGSLFVNPFKAVVVDADDQFLHVTRYIHLNPFVAHLVEDPFGYIWSSLHEYTAASQESKICHPELLRGIMGQQEYHRFVLDHADYSQSLVDNYHLLIDIDEEVS